MGSIIAFLLGVICGVVCLGLVSAGSQKEREYRAYQKGLSDAAANTK